tara:strand:- start:191 stop:454 length:264 start_codon:yes stop_codon:yes gene_type:complete
MEQFTCSTNGCYRKTQLLFLHPEGRGHPEPYCEKCGRVEEMTPYPPDPAGGLERWEVREILASRERGKPLGGGEAPSPLNREKEEGR